MKKLIAILSICFLYGCVHEPPADPTGTVEIKFDLTWDNEAFEVGQVYTDELGHFVRVGNFKAYLAKIALLKADGTQTLLSNIEIVDLAENPVISTTVAPGDYTGLKFGVGVPEELNKSVDPATYESDHPLSAVGGGANMHWTWNTGYIFVKFDGHADLTGTDPNDLTSPFAFHCGEDFLYETHEFNKAFTLENEGTQELIVEMKVDAFLHSADDTIDIEIDHTTHTGGNPELAVRFMDLMNDAISLR